MTYVFSDLVKPAVERDTDSADVTLGFRFKIADRHKASRIRIWRSDTRANTFSVFIWNNATGKAIASGTLIAKEGKGWKSYVLPTPVTLEPGSYTVGYRARNGRYPVTENYFRSNGISSSNSSVTWAENAGVYRYGSTAIPANSYKQSNYWVDIDLVPVSVPQPSTVPVFSANPSNVTVNVGETATFTASATGQSVVYSWQTYLEPAGKFFTLTGVNTNTLVIENTQDDLNGSIYRCAATNTAGTVYSAEARLFVNTPVPPQPQAPLFILQPSDTTVFEEETATFKAEASGIPVPTFVWQKSSQNVNAWEQLATGKTLVLENVSLDNSGSRYRCVADNIAGNAFSNVATLTVEQKPTLPPPAGVSHGREITSANTGARLLNPTLEVVSQVAYASKAPNGVYENKDFTRGLVVDAPIKLINCYVNGVLYNYPGFYYMEIQWCTIKPSSPDDFAIGAENYRAYRTQLLGCSDGARMNGGSKGSELFECYVRCAVQGGSDHNDGTQNYAGSGLTKVTYSNINIENLNSGGANACLFVADNAKGQTIWTHNLLAGGGYVIRAYEDTTYVVKENEILDGSWVYGPVHIYNPNNRTMDWSGNWIVERGTFKRLSQV